MANNARVSFVGTVINEPTNKQVNNTTVFSMKVGVKTTKKQEGFQYPVSDVYEVSVWGKPGENLIGKVKAKSKVWVCGDQMMGEPWTDRNNTTHVSPRVNASVVEILNFSGSQSAPQAAPQAAPQSEDPNALPF